MRISQFERESIIQIARQCFGNDAKVFLFGSRLDDNKKGGDIDLFIKCKNMSIMTLDKKIDFLTKLKLSIGDRKIDVVFDNAITRKKEKFYHSIITQYSEL